MTDKQIMGKESQLSDVEKHADSVYRYTPAVDIYETEEALVMVADMPGVDEENLQIEVARGILTLEGDFGREEGYRTEYYRQFKLSDRFDADAGEAALKDGVLTLKLPKSETEKPKKITVKTLH